jgi:hypothetical protein
MRPGALSCVHSSDHPVHQGLFERYRAPSFDAQQRIGEAGRTRATAKLVAMTAPARQNSRRSMTLRVMPKPMLWARRLFKLD